MIQDINMSDTFQDCFNCYFKVTQSQIRNIDVLQLSSVYGSIVLSKFLITTLYFKNSTLSLLYDNLSKKVKSKPEHKACIKVPISSVFKLDAGIYVTVVDGDLPLLPFVFPYP